MPILPILLAAASPPVPAAGRWDVHTIVSGADAVRRSERCLSGSGDWVRAVLPPALTAGCDDVAGEGRAACARGGSLTLTGSVFADRFDSVVTRTGPVGANPRAAVALHLEGQRLARDCAGEGRGR